MESISGRVASGAGNASQNFTAGGVKTAVGSLLGASAGDIVDGTLNIEINVRFCGIDDGQYDDVLPKSAYNNREEVMLRYCHINDVPAVIVRPSDHFVVPKFRQRVEVMSSVRLRDELALEDGASVTISFDPPPSNTPSVTDT